MIVCPTCSEELQKKGPQLKCPKCAFQPTDTDGILCFALDEANNDFADYSAEGLDLLYKYEQDHFWFKNRKRYIKRMFKKYAAKDERIIEIGAGTGNVSGMLADEGYTPELGEIHLKGLEYAKQYGLNRLYQFDARRVPFKEEYNTVSMFDVLEHIEDDQAMIKNIRQMLKKGGKLILTVPAHRFLWSSIDVVSGHKRRYQLKKLKKMMVNNGFEVLEAKYFFAFLFPFLILRKWLNTKKAQSFSDVNNPLKINCFFNWFFNLVLKLEYYLFHLFSPPFGGSIIMAARHDAAASPGDK
jgi:2-polyprenyl-3-methyl-5-hydroxy-6-metoxy-1,4-benzoquinol methylase